MTDKSQQLTPLQVSKIYSEQAAQKLGQSLEYQRDLLRSLKLLYAGAVVAIFALCGQLFTTRPYLALSLIVPAFFFAVGIERIIKKESELISSLYQEGNKFASHARKLQTHTTPLEAQSVEELMLEPKPQNENTGKNWFQHIYFGFTSGAISLITIFAVAILWEIYLVSN